jgi:hypothetical protein
MINLLYRFITFDILLHIKTEPKLIKKTVLFNLIFKTMTGILLIAKVLYFIQNLSHILALIYSIFYIISKNVTSLAASTIHVILDSRYISRKTLALVCIVLMTLIH